MFHRATSGVPGSITRHGPGSITRYGPGSITRHGPDSIYKQLNFDDIHLEQIVSTKWTPETINMNTIDSFNNLLNKSLKSGKKSTRAIYNLIKKKSEEIYSLNARSEFHPLKGDSDIHPCISSEDEFKKCTYRGKHPLGLTFYWQPSQFKTKYTIIDYIPTKDMYYMSPMGHKDGGIHSQQATPMPGHEIDARVNEFFESEHKRSTRSTVHMPTLSYHGRDRANQSYDDLKRLSNNYRTEVVGEVSVGPLYPGYLGYNRN